MEVYTWGWVVNNAIFAKPFPQIKARIKPIYKIIEEVSEKTKEAVILTDLDKEGKKLFGKLNSGLSHHGVRVDNKFREFLFKKTKLRQIEGIISYLRKQ